MEVYSLSMWCERVMCKCDLYLYLLPFPDSSTASRTAARSRPPLPSTASSRTSCPAGSGSGARRPPRRLPRAAPGVLRRRPQRVRAPSGGARRERAAACAASASPDLVTAACTAVRVSAPESARRRRGQRARPPYVPPESAPEKKRARDGLCSPQRRRVNPGRVRTTSSSPISRAFAESTTSDMLCLTSLQLTAFAPGFLRWGAAQRRGCRSSRCASSRVRSAWSYGPCGRGCCSRLRAAKQLADQGLEITVAAISKTKPDAGGERQPWMLCDEEEGCR